MRWLSRLLAFGTLFVLCLAEDLFNLTLAASKCEGKEKASELLKVSRDYINKAKDLYPNCDDDNGGWIKKDQSIGCLDFAIDMISEAKTNYLNCPEPECPKQIGKPIDCSDILLSGKKKSGVYTIWPRSRVFDNKSLDVYCDMETDGGGWTVIHRRGAFKTPKDYFYRDWASYKRGFGNLTEDFWIGNDNLFALTNQAIRDTPYKIRFDVIDAAGNKDYAEYNSFWIDDEAASYKLHISGYSGIAGDSMVGQDGMKFSTKDKDNDYWYYGSCAVECLGAWWFNNCHGYANLNGIYQPGVDSYRGITWHAWRAFVGLSGAEMKLRF